MGGGQGQPGDGGQGEGRRGGRKIEGVLQDGMSNGEKVCSDLMRVAAVGRAFYQCAVVKALKDAAIGAGWPAVGGVYNGAVAAADVDAQGAVDAERFPGGLTEADGQIGLLHLALFKSEAEPLMGWGGFGK